MSRAFGYCAQRVLEEEGGLVDHARDPGGRTNLGITAGTLREARVFLPGLPESVDELTRRDALAIYEERYWKPVRGDDLPLGLALVVFDAAVNQGVGDAARFLQAALRVNVDGKIGPQTIASALCAEPRAAISEVAARRMLDYMIDNGEAQRRTFGLGWSRRLMRIHAMALAAPEFA